ncbi:Nucleotide-binding universal stress protein, UspA family [Halorientalis persicus]|uniref:Nucleotide-binding universal stress protein, UspA family n=2 Tax=Halorientalis persicus TaxID=1367881 RepID=A0A1H8MU62_9EURY|nr:Nucleotide-binding universal stress protein, UspA family [Halorientalis persicus]
MTDTHTDDDGASRKNGSAYSRILVPTDGSDLARRALEEACTIAGLTDATIHVLYVVDDAAIAELATDASLDEVSLDADVHRLFDRFEAVGEHAIEDIQTTAGERGVDIVTAVRRGIPDEEILAYVNEQDIDLIVMGTHGRRGVQRYLLGSTTERVLRRVTTPVLAVHEQNDKM